MLVRTKGQFSDHCFSKSAAILLWSYSASLHFSSLLNVCHFVLINIFRYNLHILLFLCVLTTWVHTYILFTLAHVVSPQIRFAVLSTIILITSAIKYHYTYYKCHYPFIFHGTATFKMTFLYRFLNFFCLLTSFVLASDILFCSSFLGLCGL